MNCIFSLYNFKARYFYLCTSFQVERCKTKTLTKTAVSYFTGSCCFSSAVFQNASCLRVSSTPARSQTVNSLMFPLCCNKAKAGQHLASFWLLCCEQQTGFCLRFINGQTLKRIQVRILVCLVCSHLESFNPFFCLHLPQRLPWTCQFFSCNSYLLT